MLEFHEHLLEERNVAPDDPAPLRFQFGELFDFAAARFAAVLGERAPGSDEVRRICAAWCRHCSVSASCVSSSPNATSAITSTART